ncbi:alpha-amylase family glycosyl hydrolase [Arenibaculum pallidiluteum]|uniref:alpha-amylase family glycosyl hydrolase n=1 Tax=Arenibaculum pallidiluteum TaxID=2812559 RepID=UPI001A97760F|nr:alpha-amylase family glycosyl hydrolase [Arenibaculum pallidiluteum]
MPQKTCSAAWLEGAALYQICPLVFADGNGDGAGDLDGIRRRLDHVVALGVDAVWLTPFYPSPFDDFGYDIADHRAVDPRLGTLEDFDRLVEAAHASGLRLLVDLVCGHTAKANAWFQASRRERGGPHGDWYVWADPRPDGSPPNNWLSVFGGPAWSWDPLRRQYYLHHFLPSQPTLNLRSAAGEAMLETADFWLDRGVDGFRIDAVDFLMRDPELRSNPAAADPPPAIPTKLFGMQVHAWDMMHADVLDFLERLRARVERRPGAVLVGELSSQPGHGDRLRRYTAPGRLHAAYTLGLAKTAFTPDAFRAALMAAGTGTTCWSLSNHDVERAASRWLPPGADRARFAAFLALLTCCLPGVICVYQGEELGLPQAELRLDELRDPFGLNYWPEFPGRDGARTPMPWSAETVEPAPGAAWLPVPEAHRALAADRQAGLPGSTLEVWRACLALRRAWPALAHGRIDLIDEDGPILAFLREIDGEAVMCLFNLGTRAADYVLPEGSDYAPLELPVPGLPPVPRRIRGGGLVTVPALGAVLARREGASGGVAVAAPEAVPVPG